MIVHLFISSFFVFFVLALIVEASLTVFRVKNLRVRSFCRLLPVIKLPLDLFFYQVCHSFNFNPFSCQTKVKELIDFPLLSWLLIALTSGIALRTCVQFFTAARALKVLCREAQVCTRPLTIESLSGRANILVSDQITVPMAVHPHTILFPEELMDGLTQEEFEGIIAHELEHLRWYDPAVKFMAAIICALFWWIPTKWWMKKIEEEQEMASDLSAHAYGLDNHALAMAILKVARKAPYAKLGALCHFATGKASLKKRIQALLEGRPLQKRFVAECALGLVAFSCALFWIC